VARRLFVRLLALPVGLVLGIVIFAGLVEAGLLRNPFAPTTRGELTLARGDSAGLRVLFVGNSFTYENDLPELVHRLAPGSSPIYSVSYTAGGWTLQKFAHDRGLERVLREAHWDVVVLQEQSEIPSFAPRDRAREFDPYVRELTREIRAAGAQPLLFMTWGYRHGDKLNIPDDTFAGMQTRLEQGYVDAAREVHAAVAPVGLAWSEAISERPGLDLWANDDRHPNRAGSYLAACVFYALLEQRSPVGNVFTDGLGAASARYLQSVAWQIAQKWT
jgi:hypothetical protein